jgi:hypothetical protein
MRYSQGAGRGLEPHNERFTHLHQPFSQRVRQVRLFAQVKRVVIDRREREVVGHVMRGLAALLKSGASRPCWAMHVAPPTHFVAPLAGAPLAPLVRSTRDARRPVGPIEVVEVISR